MLGGMIADDYALPADVADLLEGLPDWTDVDPTPYPADADQDDVEGLGGPGDSLRHSKAAIAFARDLIKQHAYVGVGYCLKTVRTYFGVAALYPDAETAWEQAQHKHRTSNPDHFPWGTPGFATNGGNGHVWLNIGHGRCITTDYGQAGYIGIAPISAMAPWVRGELAGWSKDLNGVVVWRRDKPTPTPEPDPKPEPEKLWTLQDRLDFLEAALKRARENNARQRRIDSLKKWVDHVHKRLDKHSK